MPSSEGTRTLRLSDLLGRPVETADGTRLVVTGVTAVQDGPLRGAQATLRVSEVIATPPHRGTYLGFRDRGRTGPWLLRVLTRGSRTGARRLAWADVADQLVS